MVQIIYYAQEMRNLMEQEVIASNSPKTLHSFIDKEGLPIVGGSLHQSKLPYQKCIR